MKLTTVAVMAVAVAMWTACSGDGVRHTPDATPTSDGAVDASPDAPVNPAMLSGSPGATAFGDVVIGQTTSKVTYTISNDGDEASGTISVLLDPETAGFAVSDNNCSGVSLAMHATCTFAVAFTPPMAGMAMATVHVAATPGGEITRDLTGNGLQPGAINIIEASHDYTKLAVDGTPTTHTFQVQNTGQVATGIPAPSITGTANTYTVASTTCTAALAPNATCNVVVRFHPTTVGSKPGSLVVMAAPGGSDSATLSGIGIAHVAVTKSGNGTGTVTSNMTGIDCGSGCAADFSATPVTLTAVPDMGVDFAGWTGDCSGRTPCTLDLTAGKTVNATFTKQRFALTTSMAGTGMGTIALNPTGGTYNYGQMVTVTATPATGSTFAKWTGDCMGTGSCIVTMTTNHTVTANFTAIPETLTVTSAAPGGTVVSTPAGISCNGATCAHDFNYGAPVTLDVNLDPGYSVAAVAGDCTALPCTVTMDQARNVTVRIQPIAYTFTLTYNGDSTAAGSVTITTATGTTTYNAGTSFTVHYGDSVSLTEQPNPSSTDIFGGWGGACSSYGTQSTCKVQVTGNTAVSAAFLHSGYRYLVTAITAGANGLPFDVTYEALLNQSAECQSSPSPGTGCNGSLPALTVVKLVAHVPPPDFAPYSWNTLPTWTGCDSVSADSFTCTFTVNASRRITVTGDTKH